MRYPQVELALSTPTKKQPRGSVTNSLTDSQTNMAIVQRIIDQSPVKNGKRQVAPWNPSIPVKKTTFYRLRQALLQGDGLISRTPTRNAPAPKRDIIIQVLAECDTLDLSEVHARCKNILEGGISDSWLYKILDREGWTNKNCSRISKSNDPDTCKSRRKGAKLYKRNMKRWEREGKQVIHVDECTFDRGFIQGRKRRWSRRGTRAYQPAGFKFRGPSCNLITFFGNHGYQKTFLQEKRLDMAGFRDYLMEVVYEFADRGEGFALCLDGCPAHSIEALEAAKAEFPNFEYMFFPTYTPVINACEYFYNHIKGKIRAVATSLPHMTAKEWKQYVRDLIPQIIVDPSSTFDHCLAYAYQLIAAKGDLHVTKRAASLIVSELECE